MESGSRDFWTLGNGDDIPIGEAMHYIAGLSYENSSFLFSAEAYYKDLKGLSEYSLFYAPTFHQQDVDYDEFFYEGTGIAKGIEFLVQKKYGKYNGWIGYTLGEVKYNFPIYGTESFPATHDVTHEFKIGEHSIGNLGFSIFNLYNRTNTWYKTYELIEGELIETDVNLLGLTPNITLSFKLR